jgi:hypothetical protein
VSLIDGAVSGRRVRSVSSRGATPILREGLAATAAINLGGGYRPGPRAFALGRLTLLDGVFDLLSFGQAIEALIGDGRVMEKNVGAGIGLNESKTLVGDQLLDFA